MDAPADDDTPTHHCNTTTTTGVYRYSHAMGRGTLDGVGRTPSVGEERTQLQSRIRRSPSESWFCRNAPQSTLSEMFVFDHALRV